VRPLIAVTKENAMPALTRRHFIEATAATAVTGILWNNSVFAAPAAEDAGPWDLVAVRNGEAVPMFEAGIAALGGMKAFVKQGQKVVIKPNIAWDRTPEMAANTNPDLVGAIVRHCKAAGASKVVVFDHTCHNWERTYVNSGIKAAVEAAGGEMAAANLEQQYREVDLPKAKTLKKAKIHTEMLDCDVFINVPVLKHHGGAKLSLTMKNLMGVVWDRQAWHKGGLDQCVADICFAPRKPDLCIIDAYRILRKNGPQGVAKEDAEIAKYQLLGRDMVALDAAATKLFGKDPMEIGYIRIAGEMGAGQNDLSKVKVKRITL
jgi:uncharacterized protein (DUF362 family)